MLPEKGDGMEQHVFRLRVFLIVMAAVFVAGALGLMWVEGLSLGDAVYFSLVTITTVGYGDIHPLTPAGKFLTIILILGGVGTFTGAVANATELFLNRREKRLRLEKLHVVMGVFFSELGIHLLSRFAGADAGRIDLEDRLKISGDWSEDAFAQAMVELTRHKFEVDVAAVDLTQLRTLLDRHGPLLLRLLENPALLEHEAFTETLRTIFHLREELLHRTRLDGLPQADVTHLGLDVKRVYRSLALQWIQYMLHLKENYPYLFSLAARRNPFREDASVAFE